MLNYKCKLELDGSIEIMSGTASLDEILKMIDSKISKAKKECDCRGK
ncbi:MAG: hypothetical protein N3F05_03800 [Candidatus Diapherotrites archaeon]|nr:hypothetical protein [Candidatus Diapherotrites archaeon]